MAIKKTVLINSVQDTSYNCLFPESQYEVINSPEWYDCDLLLLVGHHTDVDPTLYNAKPIVECGTTCALQDSVTEVLIDKANANVVPIVGICKGAQQLCVSKGGLLIQHVPRVGGHDVVDHLSTLYNDVPADHHQVMVPRMARECNILMRNSVTMYPEVVLWDYVQKKDLAVQFHPEWASSDHKIRKWFDKYIVKEILQ